MEEVIGLISRLRGGGIIVPEQLEKAMKKININDFSYPEIETKVEEFVLEPFKGTKLIVTGSSHQMITKVENVVKTYNPFYDVLNNGIRIFKDDIRSIANIIVINRSSRSF